MIIRKILFATFISFLKVLYTVKRDINVLHTVKRDINIVVPDENLFSSSACVGFAIYLWLLSNFQSSGTPIMSLTYSHCSELGQGI